ncbi:hypothetical protein XM38_024480 [Halomicronema hongdechloris C2206]|uniref:Uncharacterized protein n=1 Tax=Halomicronema hongdechloris C2206 TaxID=1641165 RepID=A0A1Z3HML0_9CYAN|nr:multiheme c-type cytochrome [Halomicronema hongdechloris]ASC71496.1 hypothetical protein XM38_024480 [Halomicronema hongdechloris C2206]
MKPWIAMVLALLLMLVYPAPAGGEGVTSEAVEEATQLWQESLHALNQVNCSSCHQPAATRPLQGHPDHESCRSCHKQAVETFLLGKHGVRLLEGQSPLTPAMARLPMKAAAHQRQMTCATCHDVHSVNTVAAAVDACLSCHNDAHSLNYENSKHAQLFAADRQLPRPSATAVSCATCHLPRHQVKAGEGTLTQVNHNNNTYTLLPRDRMVKEVCMGCHTAWNTATTAFLMTTWWRPILITLPVRP